MTRNLLEFVTNYDDGVGAVWLRLSAFRYEGGVLKPLERLDLREGESVRIVVLRGARGLSEVIEKISREYRDVREDPLKVLLEGRR